MTIAEGVTLVRRRGRSVVAPIALIGLGLLFLAQNLGLVGPDVWTVVLKCWPLLLVAVGVEMVLGRATWRSAFVVAIFGAVAASLLAWNVFVGRVPGSGFGFLDGVTAATNVERVDEALDDVRTATVELRHGAGKLSVSALPADSMQLVKGELGYNDFTTIERRIDRQGDRAQVILGAQEKRDVSHGRLQREDWSVQLSPRVATELRVASGASDMQLDLGELKVTRLTVDTGASGARIALPRAAGQTSVQIRVGAAGITIEVPEGVAARIHRQGGLSGIGVDEGRFPSIGNGTYQSANYESAANRVDITLDTGVAGVSVR